MRVHHLNCVSTCPLGGKLMDGRTESILRRGYLADHCLLVEYGDGLALVDTGLGTRDVENPRDRLSGFFLSLLRPDFRREMTAIRQVEALGYAPEDVRHIVLTHLDFDHAGGLDDFPWARVHLLAAEREAAELQKTWLDRARYRPAQWSTRANWRTYEVAAGERWLGFERTADLDGLPPEILLIPLTGHTFGHAGVAVRENGRWLLQAGDAYFFRGEMELDAPWCTPGLRFYQWMMQKDKEARLRNQERLRELKRERGREVEIFCGHDPEEYERLSGRPASLPARALRIPTARV